MLQTHPQEEVLGPNVQGVQSIEYSGAYPVSKLKVRLGVTPLFWKMECREKIQKKTVSSVTFVATDCVTENVQL